MLAAETSAPDPQQASADGDDAVTRSVDFLERELPFTGGKVWWLAALGAVLGAVGLSLRRAQRTAT